MCSERNPAKPGKIDEILQNCENLQEFEFEAMQRYVNLVDLEKCSKNNYLLAKISADTAENEPAKVWT